MSAQTAPLRMVTRPSLLPGYIHGLRHPAVMTALAVADGRRSEWLDRAEAALDEALALPDAEDGPAPDGQAPIAVVAALLRALHRMQQAAGLAVTQPGRMVGTSQSGLVIVVPTMAFGHEVTVAALVWAMRLFALAAAGVDLSRHLEALPELLAALRVRQPPGSNTPRFLRAAGALGLPIRELPGGIVQVGNGARSRWLESSYTDRTSRIGAGIAHDKRIAAAIMRQAGIPVPDHLEVQDEASALEAADRLGYPVVVKPADREGGTAVAAGLLTPSEVRKAYAAASAVSTSILVEKHFEGRDYRLVVFESELLLAIERVPGGVTGNGVTTISGLIEEQGADPRRSARGPWTRLVLDQEADDLLRRAGLDRHSVPAEGEFVRLRRAANIATGGTPVAVQHLVHPDNRLLAIRAAAALRLDLAGVDLLIPDIGRSWLETGAAICEVNGQPNLGQATSAHLYGLILQGMIAGNGRIPIAVVLGAPPGSRVARAIADDLAGQGMTVGRADGSRVSIGGRIIADEKDPFRAGLALMMDRRVEAAVVSVDQLSALSTGLAFDRFDVLLIAGDHLAYPDSASRRSSAQLKSMLKAMLPMCDGAVLTMAGVARPAIGPDSTPARLEPMPLSESGAARTVSRLLREAAARNAQRA